jgi:Protein of unknown function (DUF1580)
MVDFSKEITLPLSLAARRIPRRRREKPVHVATLHRCATKGCRGIKLETLQIGGAKYTSIEALQRFFERLTSLEATGAK